MVGRAMVWVMPFAMEAEPFVIDRQLTPPLQTPSQDPLRQCIINKTGFLKPTGRF